MSGILAGNAKASNVAARQAARGLLLVAMLIIGPAMAEEKAPQDQPAAAQPEQAATSKAQQPAPAETQKEAAAQPSPNLKPTESEAVFLDRLMMAESGGREDAKNPRSTALGPFQFLSSTFLDLMTRHFAAVTGGKTDAEILQMRTDHKIAREAALVYTRENAAFLKDRGVEASAAHLRLAFLVGPSGASRVIAAEPDTPVSQLLSAAALEANPFMSGMTAQQLLERSANEAAGVRLVTLPMRGSAKPKPPGIRVRCNLARPSCRRWVSLATKRQARRTVSQAKTAPETTKKD